MLFKYQTIILKMPFQIKGKLKCYEPSYCTWFKICAAYYHIVLSIVLWTIGIMIIEFTTKYQILETDHGDLCCDEGVPKVFSMSCAAICTYNKVICIHCFCAKNGPYFLTKYCNEIINIWARQQLTLQKVLLIIENAI